MKKILIFASFLLLFASSSYSQTSGTYIFGEENNPDMTMEPSYSGYDAFATAIINNTDSNMNVDWSGVCQEIASVQSLANYKTWLGVNNCCVLILCCTVNGNNCHVAVPLGCHLCTMCGSNN